MATTPYTPSSTDPFSGGIKIPSLSWRALPIGSTFTLQVLEGAKLLQGRDFDTNQPAYWDEEKRNPIMNAVINVRVLAGPHSVGEDRSVWAQKPSNIFLAIAKAQQDAGQQIAPGGILHLRFIGETPHTNARNNPIKNYEAKYVPPAAYAFASVPPVAQPQYAQPARSAQPLPSAAAVQQQITPPVAPGWPGATAAQPTTPSTW